MNGRPNGRNKAGYSNFFCVVWMLSEAGEVNSDVDVLNSRKYKYSWRSKWSTEDKQQRTMKKERNLSPQFENLLSLDKYRVFGNRHGLQHYCTVR